MRGATALAALGIFLTLAFGAQGGQAGASGAHIELYETHSEAGYFSRGAVKSARTVLTVPQVRCQGVKAGRAAGQAYGITLDGERSTVTPWAAVVVRAFCEGRRPRYEGYFIIPGIDRHTSVTEVYSTADIAVRPRERFDLSATDTDHLTRLSIENLRTAKRAQTDGPGFETEGAIFRVSTISATSAGGALGSARIIQTAKRARLPTIAGPVPATAAQFADPRINGRPLRSLGARGEEVWVREPRLVAVPTALVRVHDHDAFFMLVRGR